jgi:triacylglycerol lipase
MSERDGELMGVLTQELLSMVDFGSLWFDPVFYGIHVAPGDGKLVVVIPGMFGNDFYLQPLLNWLGCMGYTPVCSTLRMNTGCGDRMRAQVLSAIERRQGNKPRSVALIGHSRGGILAWAIAAQLREQVSHVVMLGAPIATMQQSIESGANDFPLSGVNRMMLQASKFSRQMSDPDCRFPHCGCAFVDDSGRTLSPATSVLSIYGRDDQVMPDAAKYLEGETLEVNTGHVGLVYHPAVYRALGRFLAENRGGHDLPAAA